jgi:hypothetical protein
VRATDVYNPDHLRIMAAASGALMSTRDLATTYVQKLRQLHQELGPLFAWADGLHEYYDGLYDDPRYAEAIGGPEELEAEREWVEHRRDDWEEKIVDVCTRLGEVLLQIVNRFHLPQLGFWPWTSLARPSVDPITGGAIADAASGPYKKFEYWLDFCRTLATQAVFLAVWDRKISESYGPKSINYSRRQLREWVDSVVEAIRDDRPVGILLPEALSFPPHPEVVCRVSLVAIELLISWLGGTVPGIADAEEDYQQVAIWLEDDKQVLHVGNKVAIRFKGIEAWQVWRELLRCAPETVNVAEMVGCDRSADIIRDIKVKLQPVPWLAKMIKNDKRGGYYLDLPLSMRQPHLED